MINNTPRIGHPPIKMRNVESVERLRSRGDFCITTDDDGSHMLHLMVPANYVRRCCYTRWKIGPEQADQKSWRWDGNLESPTMKPELHARTVWCGRVTSGLLIEAPPA